MSNDAVLAAVYGTSRELFARNMAEVVEAPGSYTVTVIESNGARGGNAKDG